MRRNTWKANKIVSFRWDAPPRVPSEPAQRFLAVDIDGLTPVDVDSIARWLRLEAGE